MAYIVQQFSPAPGVYTPVSGELMDPGMQRALLEFHVKIGEARIGFLDGWHANIYFEEVEQGRFVCGVLDQDRVWRLGDGLKSTWEPDVLQPTLDIFRDPRTSLILSLAECRYSPRSQMLLEMGYCPWPDGEFLMMKMIEHRGWIKYDRAAGKFVSDRMDIKIVEEYFPKLNHPDSIDTKFDVPEHLRHLVPDAPAGGGGRGLFPEPEAVPEPVAILPFVDAWPGYRSIRIAA